MSDRLRRRLALLDDVPEGQLLVHEVYRSLQGESTHQGFPCVFVRLAVCDLRCTWCDTPHAFNQGEPRSLDELVAEVGELQAPGSGSLVELTGGEPLLQPAVHPLMTRLCDAGYQVLIETSGGRDIAPVDPRVRIIMDLKCPDSGEAESNRWQNIAHLRSKDEVKLVIASRGDFDWACDIIARHQLSDRCPLLFSAAWNKVALAELAAWVTEASIPGARMQLQLHKFVWGADTQGV